MSGSASATWHWTVVPAPSRALPDERLSLDGTRDLLELIEHCRAELAACTFPRAIFVDELPKTARGKILRRELR